jgi:hypothetical protein
MTGTTGWTCLGSGPAHVVEREPVETIRSGGGSTSVFIERCRRCACLYRHVEIEVSDWGPSGDYSDITYIWTPIAAAELEAARADWNYSPRSTASYRYDTGWKAV